MDALISIIIPTFNRAHVIADTLMSVKNQTYKNWECLIVDDGSKDNTIEVLQPFLMDQRFIYFLRPDSKVKGAASCRNIGIDLAKGTYIQFLDSDDLLAPNKFEKQLMPAGNAPNKANTVVTCKWGGLRPEWPKPLLYNGLPTYISTSDPLKLFLIFAFRFTFLPIHVYLIPVEIIKKSGYWDEELTVNDDGEYFAKVLLNCSQILFSEDTYVLYRSGAGNRLNSNITSPEGIQSYIRSWELINNYILANSGIKNHIYVKQARARLYERLSKKKNSSNYRNLSFFEDKTPLLKYYYIKYLSSLKNRISRKSQAITTPDFTNDIS